jgi:hypothetical protein
MSPLREVISVPRKRGPWRRPVAILVLAVLCVGVWSTAGAAFGLCVDCSRQITVENISAHDWLNLGVIMHPAPPLAIPLVSSDRART